MNQKSIQALSTPEYWNQRYATSSSPNPSSNNTNAPSHEWFQTFTKLRPFLEKYLPDKDGAVEPRILHLGCGDSTLPNELSTNLGYKSQLGVDFSPTIIDQMRSKHPHISWSVQDIRSLTLEDASFDVAIDKGTLDSLLHGSPWDPPASVRQNVAQYVDQVARVLKPGGKWLYITYRQPHFVESQVEREGVWGVSVVRLGDGEGGGGVFQYFAYVMRKS